VRERNVDNLVPPDARRRDSSIMSNDVLNLIRFFGIVVAFGR
jgi:hypothetical protein